MNWKQELYYETLQIGRATILLNEGSNGFNVTSYVSTADKMYGPDGLVLVGGSGMRELGVKDRYTARLMAIKLTVEEMLNRGVKE